MTHAHIVCVFRRRGCARLNRARHQWPSRRLYMDPRTWFASHHKFSAPAMRSDIVIVPFCLMDHDLDGLKALNFKCSWYNVILLSWIMIWLAHVILKEFRFFKHTNKKGSHACSSNNLVINGFMYNDIFMAMSLCSDVVPTHRQLLYDHEVGIRHETLRIH